MAALAPQCMAWSLSSQSVPVKQFEQLSYLTTFLQVMPLHQCLVVFQFGAVVFLEPWRNRIRFRENQLQNWYALTFPILRCRTVAMSNLCKMMCDHQQGRV
jgi:hypothetical protein